MGINADLRDAMISLFEQHMHCDANPYPCNVGDEFMDYMNEWIKN